MRAREDGSESVAVSRIATTAISCRLKHGAVLGLSSWRICGDEPHGRCEGRGRKGVSPMGRTTAALIAIANGASGCGAVIVPSAAIRVGRDRGAVSHETGDGRHASIQARRPGDGPPRALRVNEGEVRQTVNLGDGP